MNQKEYERGFKRGYVVTYCRLRKTSIEPIVPICPIAPIKSITDVRSDYEAGFEKGAEYALNRA